MAFSELMKNFDHLRDYMRDFYIYGFKTRADYEQKSSRTYDNERRRIESYLGDYIQWRYGRNGKHLFLSLDAGLIPQNPFYKAYRSKSFTDNDITLHFLLLDILAPGRQLTVSQITDELLDGYGLCYDQQTVRNKLREYADLGLLTAQKDGRSLLYGHSPHSLDDLLARDAASVDFLAFCSEALPFAVVGSYLSDWLGFPNERLRFKHRFLFHTLDDGIALTAIQAIEQGRLLEAANFSTKTQKAAVFTGLPLAILVSCQNGRRYLALYDPEAKHLYSLRLDYIRSARLADVYPEAWTLRQQQLAVLDTSWGASLPVRPHLEHLSMTITADERSEAHIIRRLQREKRQGTITRLAPNIYRFDIDVCDSGELLGWVKTFIGRIIRLEGDNQKVIDRFYSDLRRLYGRYEVND